MFGATNLRQPKKILHNRWLWLLKHLECLSDPPPRLLTNDTSPLPPLLAMSAFGWQIKKAKNMLVIKENPTCVSNCQNPLCSSPLLKCYHLTWEFVWPYKSYFCASDSRLSGGGQVTGEMWHVTGDRSPYISYVFLSASYSSLCGGGQVTCDMKHVTRDRWHVKGPYMSLNVGSQKVYSLNWPPWLIQSVSRNVN